MSLFAHPEYRWRETYCVFFKESQRPQATDVQAAFSRLGDRYQLKEIHGDEDGNLDSLTMISPPDFAAMDISFVSGEEVQEQQDELLAEIDSMAMDEDEKQKLKKLKTCDARYDIYHFEQLVDFYADDDEEEFLDPAALLIVLDWFAALCGGVGIDPQANTIM